MLEACPWNTVGLSMDFPRVAVNAGPARVFVKQWLDSPLAFFMKTESVDRDPTWMQAAPTVLVDDPWQLSPCSHRGRTSEPMHQALPVRGRPGQPCGKRRVA